MTTIPYGEWRREMEMIDRYSAQPGTLLGYHPLTAQRGRIVQIADRLRALSRQPGIAHTAQAKLLQLDARDLEAIMRALMS